MATIAIISGVFSLLIGVFVIDGNMAIGVALILSGLLEIIAGIWELSKSDG
jgi:hypothetical protein